MFWKPQRLRDDDKVETVVCPLENDEYEVISGHRRLHACQKAGIETVPAFLYALEGDAAAVALVGSKLHSAVRNGEVRHDEKEYA